jgi:DNA-binding winged helix-turn-helix (wHTH) protein
LVDIIKIGEWQFHPDKALLSLDGEPLRLESRAAAVLELLCRRNGDVVSHEEFIAEIWNGRFVSSNSVAVVIRDIRNSLNDNAKSPRYIETVPKRGYRIAETVQFLSEVENQADEIPDEIAVADGFIQTHKNKLAAFFIILTLLAGALFFTIKASTASNSADFVSVSVGEFKNDTEDETYDPLSAAMSELVTTELMRYGNINISTRSDAKILVRGNIIIWDGHVAVGLHAENTNNGELIWSGMASGPESELPRQVRKRFEGLVAKLEDQSNQ